MSYRVQWREWRGHLKVPTAGEVRWEEGHDVDTAAAKIRELLAESPCWIYVERTDVDFKGKSDSKPKRAKELKR